MKISRMQLRKMIMENLLMEHDGWFNDPIRHGKTEAQEYFYEDSPSNFKMLVNKRLRQILTALRNGSKLNPMGGDFDFEQDWPIVRDEFLPAIESAIMDNWRKYPTDRFNIEHSYYKHHDFPGHSTLSNEVSRHFRSALRSYSSTILPVNKQDVTIFLENLLSGRNEQNLKNEI